MRLPGPRLGWIGLIGYVAIFVAEYFRVASARGFLYDLNLQLLVLPYALTGRLLTGDATFGVHAHEPWGLVPAVLFCGALVWLAGAGAARVGGWVRRRRGSGDGPKGP